MSLTGNARGMLRAAGLSTVIFLAGCAVHAGVGYRVYDPGHSDYHVWDNGEVGFYNQWAVETHHDPHRDFRKLPKNDQSDYWKWRHDHH